jgi:hypothetical protein
MKLVKRDLTIGTGLLISFAVILVSMFLPLFDGQKPIDYLDSLYNSISKGSVYYIPKLKEEAKYYEGKKINAAVSYLTATQADDLIHQYKPVLNQIRQQENKVVFEGDLGILLRHILQDADQMFNNRGDELESRTGIAPRHLMFNWWTTLKAVKKKLTNEKRFEEAKFVSAIQNRAVECSFNYFGVVPREISTAVVLVIGSLIFYITYTLWFGFSIMYLFTGLGLKLEH